MLRSLAYALVLAAQAFALPAAATAGEKFAFLVAVNDYDERQLKPLQYARQDITDLSNALVGIGFRRENVVVMHDDLKPQSSAVSRRRQADS